MDDTAERDLPHDSVCITLWSGSKQFEIQNEVAVAPEAEQ